jgi:hypothetical protein
VSHAWNELLRLSIMFNLSDHAEKNEICGWGSGILDILFKMPDLQNSLFRG